MQNVVTWKYLNENGECECLFYTEYILRAKDTSNFDKGKWFGPFGWHWFKDEWFDGKGFNFTIHSNKEERRWEGKFLY